MGILLSSEQDHDVTIISNTFIDRFMPQANGVCVKVYLYLLRRLSGASAASVSELSVSSIADMLGDTEGDVLRAFSWLEDRGLIRLGRSGANVITDIYILKLSGEKTPGDTNSAAIMEAAAADTLFPAAESTAPSKASACTAGEKPVPVSTSEAVKNNRVRLEIPTYSKTQIRELTKNDEVKWIMSIAERYLERLLNPADIQLIIYLYESVGFPADLILYLYEYCASRDKKNPSYIEAVAINWAEQGIRTVAQAEESTARYSAGYQTVAKAFGLNRLPGAAEQQYIDKWTGQFGFSLDIVEEACSRSLLSTQRPDFKYADKILENWYKKGIHTKQDIARADQQHAQNAAVKVTHSNNTVKNNNRFNAFPQRAYSGEDYSSMEQRLLNRQGS